MKTCSCFICKAHEVTLQFKQKTSSKKTNCTITQSNNFKTTGSPQVSSMENMCLNTVKRLA